MTKYILSSFICILLLVAILVNSCSGQERANNSFTENSALAKTIPKIIGTPPPLNPLHNPYNDTGLVSQYIRSIFQDSKGHFWFGPAGESVVRYDGSTLEYFGKAEFFQGNTSGEIEDVNSVHAITEDQSGNIWFGTYAGAVKYNGKVFKSYTEKDGLGNTKVGRKSILVDKSGKVWVGTQAGVFSYNPITESAGELAFSQFTSLPPVNVKGMMEDKDGGIWFASQDQGVFRYSINDHSITNLNEIEGLGDGAAGGMAQDKSGNYWFVMKGGICKYNGESFTKITTKDGLGGSEVWGVFIASSGIIWVTARGSTTRYDPSLPISDPKAFTVFTVADGLNCCVQSMYEDRSGNMWWGTGQGLYRFNGQSFYQVKQNGPW